MNKNLTIAAVVVTVLIVVYMGVGIIKEKLIEQAIQSLKRDYVPGPYDPGFNPDKVDPNRFRKSIKKVPFLRELDFEYIER